MALIKCSECGKEINDKLKECPYCGKKNNLMLCGKCEKEISKKAKKCPYCGIKIKNLKILLPLTIFLIVIAIILAFFLIARSTSDYYFYNYDYYYKDYLLQGKIMLSINFIIIAISIFIIFKLFKNKESILSKILIFICVGITFISSGIYMSKYLYAKKFDFDNCIKELVDNNFKIEQAKKIKNELYDIMFYDIQISNDEYTKNEMRIDLENYNSDYMIFNVDFGYGKQNFKLYIKINDDKIENIYWQFNDDINLFYYKDYKENKNKNYYLQAYMGLIEEDIKEDIKEKLKAPTSAIFGEFELYYVSDDDVFYYLVDVNSQNSFGAMVRTKFRIDLINTNTNEVDYTINVID